MRVRKVLTILVLSVLVFGVFSAGCIGGKKTTSTSSSGTDSPVKTSTAEKITITDLAGRKVQVPAHVSRVVAIGPGCLRLMVYLNATDKVVGVEGCEKRWGPYGRPYIMAHPELADLPVIGPGGPWNPPDPEAIMKVKPDVIFMTYYGNPDELQAKTGIPVVVLSYGATAGMKGFNDPKLISSLQLAGKILGKEKRAKELVDFLDSVQEDLQKRTEGVTPKRAYVGGIGHKGAHGIESTYGYYPPFEVLHVKNVASELGEKYLMIDREKLLEWQPDYIFIDEGGLKLVLQDYKKNPDFYNALKAVKNGNVYGLLPFNFYNTNIGTALADAYFIGKVLYPDCFKDVDPAKKADEIYTFLVGKPVYGEMAKVFGGFGRINLENETVQYSLPTSP